MTIPILCGRCHAGKDFIDKDGVLSCPDCGFDNSDEAYLEIGSIGLSQKLLDENDSNENPVSKYETKCGKCGHINKFIDRDGVPCCQECGHDNF